MNNINLATGKSIDLEKRVKNLKLLRTFAILSLLIIASISVIFFIITFTLPISSVKKDQQQTLSGISLLHKRLVTYSLISERIKSISGITSTRSTFPKLTETIMGKITSDLTIETFNLETKDLNMSVSSNSLIPINTFINEMIDLANSGKSFKNLTIQNLIYNSASGKYSVVFQADIM